MDSGVRTRTKERILDAAEELFAEHGYAATSLRDISAKAGVNLAAINYHFRSKEGLLEAVIDRRLEPVNRKRLEMLEACEAAGLGPYSVEALLEAFIAPALRAAGPGGLSAALPRLLGRIHAEPGGVAGAILHQRLHPVASRFLAAFQRALPGLPETELLWRLHFVIGTLVHTLMGADLINLNALCGGRLDLSDVETLIKRMVAFAAAGLRAPVSGEQRARALEGAAQ